MILLLARNDEVTDALANLEAEGYARRDIRVANPKYEGALDRVLVAGERVSEVVIDSVSLRRLSPLTVDDLYAAATKAGFSVRSLAPELDEHIDDDDRSAPAPPPLPRKKARKKATRKKA